MALVRATWIVILQNRGGPTSHIIGGADLCIPPETVEQRWTGQIDQMLRIPAVAAGLPHAGVMADLVEVAVRAAADLEARVSTVLSGMSIEGHLMSFKANETHCVK